MLSDTLKSNIEALREFFYEKSDPKCPGENPACRPLEDAIVEEMNKWNDDSIKTFESSLTEDEQELLYSVFWELAETRTYLCPKYTGGWFPNN